MDIKLLFIGDHIDLLNLTEIFSKWFLSQYFSIRIIDIQNKAAHSQRYLKINSQDQQKLKQ